MAKNQSDREWSGEQTLQVAERWKRSERLRAEFGGSVNSYMAFVHAMTAGRIQRSTLPFELAGIFEGVPVDDPPAK